MMDMEHASRGYNDPINPSHNRRSAGEQLKSMKLNIEWTEMAVD